MERRAEQNVNYSYRFQMKPAFGKRRHCDKKLGSMKWPYALKLSFMNVSRFPQAVHSARTQVYCRTMSPNAMPLPG